LATGFWNSVDELQEQWQIEKKFVPDMEEERRVSLRNGWMKAVKAAMSY